MIAQQLLNGLVLGGVYALFALGFTLIFGIHRIMNMAHGAVFMVGAFVGLYTVRAGLPLWLALPVAMVAAGLVSILIEVIAFKPLRKLALADAELASIISSIGAGLIVLSIGQYVSKTETMRFPFGTVSPDAIAVLGLRVTMLQLLMLGVAVVGVGLLAFYLYRTAQGRQIRAVAGNYRAAQLLGVNPNAIFYQTFFPLGCAGWSGRRDGWTGLQCGAVFDGRALPAQSLCGHHHRWSGQCPWGPGRWLAAGLVAVDVGRLSAIPAGRCSDLHVAVCDPDGSPGRPVRAERA